MLDINFKMLPKKHVFIPQSIIDLVDTVIFSRLEND